MSALSQNYVVFLFILLLFALNSKYFVVSRLMLNPTSFVFLFRAPNDSSTGGGECRIEKKRKSLHNIHCLPCCAHISYAAVPCRFQWHNFSLISFIPCDKWIPVITTWCVFRLRMEERPPMWRVAANILNKQSRTADKGWSSSLGVGRCSGIPRNFVQGGGGFNKFS